MCCTVICMLRDVENANLGVALKGCHPEMAKIVLENLSKRLRAMILEDMDFMGPLREADIMEAMDSMSDLIEKLESSGEIFFQREVNEMVAAVIWLVSSVASIALRIADRKEKYIIVTEILSLVGTIAVLVAICRGRKDDEDMYFEEA